MKITQLTKITKPTNNSVKLFSWERFYIATWSLDWNNINLEKSEKVTFENKPSRANQEVEVWDVIFAKMQWTKKTLIITDFEKDYIFSSWFFVLRPWNEILSWYLKHFLNSASFLEQKDRNCTWATQKALTLEWLQKIQIPLPPLSTQKQIIQKLDKLTDLINLKKELISKSEKLTKSVFIEMFWDPMINEKGWEVKKLDEINDFIDYRWKTPKTEEYWIPILTAKVVRKWFLDFSRLEYISENLYNKIMTRWFPNVNDVLFTTEWATMWYTCRIPNLNKFAVWQRLITLQPILWLCKSEFLDFIMNTDFFFSEITKRATWSSAKWIRSSEFKKIQIPLPPISLQNKFAEIVQKNEENIKKQKESLEKLEELYNWVMQESFRF